MDNNIIYQTPVSVTHVLKSINVFCSSSQGSTVEMLTEKYDWEDELWD